RELPLASQQAPQFRRELANRPLAPQYADGAVFCRRHQPRGGVLRHALKLPHLHRARESVLNDVLRERDVVDPENARQGCQQPAGFATKEMFVGDHWVYIGWMGRTSTVPPPS